MEKLHKFYSKYDCQYLTHDFHPYPHKIVPQIASALIQEYSQVGDIVLDCFCGSGTSLLEANLLERNAVGIDINPLACLIAKVKTTPINIENLNNTIQHLVCNVDNHLKGAGTLTDFKGRVHPKIQEFKERDKWFCKNAILGLSVIKELILRIEDKDIYDFCLVAFSYLVKEVSNASYLYRLTKAKRPNNPTLSRIAYLYKIKLNDMAWNIKKLNKTSCYSKVVNDDARYINMEKVDFVFMNFPKFNMDFLRCFKIYSWWMDFDIKKVNEKMIGTKKRKNEYYRDVEFVLQNIYRFLQSGKYCALLVTDSYDKGCHLDHGNVVKQIGLNIGFSLKDQIVRIIPKRVMPFVSKDRKEDILIFEKKIKN